MLITSNLAEYSIWLQNTVAFITIFAFCQMKMNLIASFCYSNNSHTPFSMIVDAFPPLFDKPIVGFSPLVTYLSVFTSPFPVTCASCSPQSAAYTRWPSYYASSS